MKTSAALLSMLLWQGPLVVNLRAPARPENLRYERPVEVAKAVSGMSCAVLDSTVLAHTATAAHGDLRLFQTLPGEPAAEVPFTLTESGPEPVADTTAVAQHVAVQANRLSFDLQMPSRPYAEVRLRLRMQDFVATATVEGIGARGDRHALGSVPLYDLSGQQLGHWSSLLLAEATWPVLHVVLEVRSPEGAAKMDLNPAMVEGAEVPPSRLRQTRYVPAASTTAISQRGFLSVALLRVPAHVPVERVAFAMVPGYAGNYAREATVSARADQAPVTDTEALDAGAIENVSWPSGDPRLYPIRVHEDSLEATLGATLVRPATVLVAVNNNGRGALPIQTVTLEMRERKVCFFADREAVYTLRYGDAALAAPVYDESGLGLTGELHEAKLGPERENPHFEDRRESRPLLKRHPELFWLLVLLCAGMMGGSALHHVQHRRV